MNDSLRKLAEQYFDKTFYTIDPIAKESIIRAYMDGLRAASHLQPPAGSGDCPLCGRMKGYVLTAPSNLQPQAPTPTPEPDKVPELQLHRRGRQIQYGSLLLRECW